VKSEVWWKSLRKTTDFLGRMKKSIPIFRVHLTAVFMIPVDTRGVLLELHRSIMSLPGQALTLVGR